MPRVRAVTAERIDPLAPSVLDRLGDEMGDVGLPASGHRDVRRRGAGRLADGDVRVVDGLALGAVDGGGVCELDVLVDELRGQLPWSTYGRVLGDRDDLVSRFLGNPEPVQGDMQVECQLDNNGIYCGDGDYLRRPEAQALVPGASAWRLLLQVDSHEDETGMMWGDVGRLYFWIKEHDLASQSWDATWMVLQCG